MHIEVISAGCTPMALALEIEISGPWYNGMASRNTDRDADTDSQTDRHHHQNNKNTMTKTKPFHLIGHNSLIGGKKIKRQSARAPAIHGVVLHHHDYICRANIGLAPPAVQPLRRQKNQLLLFLVCHCVTGACLPYLHKQCQVSTAAHWTF